MASSRYLALLREAAELHVRKSAGYAGKDNPDTWANFRQAAKLGITPLKGAMIRLGDKWERACNLVRDPSNEQVGEALHETLVDGLAYFGISACLLAEERLGPEQPVWPDLRWPLLTLDQADALVSLDRMRTRPVADLHPDAAAAIDRVLITFGAQGSGEA